VVEKILNDVVKRINIRLKEIKMTQKEFSRRLGKNENWLANLPHVQANVKLKDLISACGILQVEPSYLLSDNFSGNVCDMSLEEVVKMLVKKECDDYLERKLGKIEQLLQHIRKEYET